MDHSPPPVQTHSVQVIEELEGDPLQWSLVYQDKDEEKYFYFLVSPVAPTTPHHIPATPPPHSNTPHHSPITSPLPATSHHISPLPLHPPPLPCHSPPQSSSTANKEEWVQRVKKILQSLEALARGDLRALLLPPYTPQPCLLTTHCRFENKRNGRQ